MENGDSGDNPPFRKCSPKVTAVMAEQIRRLRKLGMMQHDIAAKLGVNQGRVSEVLTGKRNPPPQPGLFD
jgi:predicted transcriptional regulator